MSSSLLFLQILILFNQYQHYSWHSVIHVNLYVCPLCSLIYTWWHTINSSLDKSSGIPGNISTPVMTICHALYTCYVADQLFDLPVASHPQCVFLLQYNMQQEHSDQKDDILLCPFKHLEACLSYWRHCICGSLNLHVTITSDKKIVSRKSSHPVSAELWSEACWSTTTTITARQVTYHGLLLQLPLVFAVAEMLNLFLPREEVLPNSEKAKEDSGVLNGTCGHLKVCELVLEGQRLLRKGSQLRVKPNVPYDCLRTLGGLWQWHLHTSLFIHQLQLARSSYCFYCY